MLWSHYAGGLCSEVICVGFLDLENSEVAFVDSCLYFSVSHGENVRKSFNGRNLQQMTRVTKGLCLYKNSDPKELSAPAPGLYTCIKT